MAKLKRIAFHKNRKVIITAMVAAVIAIEVAVACQIAALKASIGTRTTSFV